MIEASTLLRQDQAPKAIWKMAKLTRAFQRDPKNKKRATLQQKFMGGALVLVDPHRVERHLGSSAKLTKDGTILGKNRTVLGRRTFVGDSAEYYYTQEGMKALIDQEMERQAKEDAEMDEEGEEEIEEQED